MVNKLLALVEEATGSFECSPEEAPRLFAAAGLMRCCALLRGIRVLESADLGQVPGILERQHWETWLLSLHILFRGDEALRELAADDVLWKRPLAKKLLSGRAYHEDLDIKPAKLNFKNLADDLGPLLVAAGEAGNPDGSKGYDITYRVQSTFSVHSNLSTFGAYVHYGAETWSIIPNPPAAFRTPSQTPALHTVHLAQYVFKAFGLATDELDQIGDALFADLKKQVGAQ